MASRAPAIAKTVDVGCFAYVFSIRLTYSPNAATSGADFFLDFASKPLRSGNNIRIYFSIAWDFFFALSLSIRSDSLLSVPEFLLCGRKLLFASSSPLFR